MMGQTILTKVTIVNFPPALYFVIHFNYFFYQAIWYCDGVSEVDKTITQFF